MNPKVFFSSIVIVWSFIIWAMVDAEGCKIETGKWQAWITKDLGWVYVGGINLFLLVCMYLVFSKYGDLRLAKDQDEKPDFTYATWFSMLFSAGIGIGLFFWGVGEPVCTTAGYPDSTTIICRSARIMRQLLRALLLSQDMHELCG